MNQTNESKSSIFIKKKLSQILRTNRKDLQRQETNTPSPCRTTKSITEDSNKNTIGSTKLKRKNAIIIAKAKVIKDFTPSPYDERSLCIKVTRVFLGLFFRQLLVPSI